jgi:hypothetical protein
LAVELFQGDLGGRVGVEFRVPAKCFGEAAIFVVQEGRERVEEVCGQNGSLRLRQVERKFFHFGDGSHPSEAIEMLRGGKGRGVD